MFPLHQLCQLGNHVRVLISNILLFPDIVREIVQFDFQIAARHILTNGLPITDSNRLLTAVTGELAVQEWPGVLRFT